MDGRRIDRIARFLAHATSRRTLVTSLAGGTLAGTALAGGIASASAADPTDGTPAIGERQVLFFELMAATLSTETGDCAAVTRAFQQFQTQNAAEMAALRAEEKTWSSAQRLAHREAYNERISQAAARLHAVTTRCGFHPHSTSPFCLADLQSDSPARQATPMANAGPEVVLLAAGAGAVPVPARLQSDIPCRCDQPIDTNCWCVTNPPTTGDCWEYAGFCLGGDKFACCWSGICIDWNSGICQIQAPNCCNFA